MTEETSVKTEESPESQQSGQNNSILFPIVCIIVVAIALVLGLQYLGGGEEAVSPSDQPTIGAVETSEVAPVIVEGAVTEQESEVSVSESPASAD